MWIIATRRELLWSLLGVLLTPLLFSLILLLGALALGKKVFLVLGLPARAFWVTLLVLSLPVLGVVCTQLVPGRIVPLAGVGWAVLAIFGLGWLVSGAITVAGHRRSRGWLLLSKDSREGQILTMFEAAVAGRFQDLAYGLCTAGYRSRVSRKEFTKLTRSLVHLLHGPIETDVSRLDPCWSLLPQNPGRDLAAVVLGFDSLDDRGLPEHVVRIVIRRTPEGLRIDNVERLAVPVTKSREELAEVA